MGFKADDVFDLVYYTIRFCAWQVDFVDDWKYIKVMIQCKVYVCKCLSLDSLCSVYYKDCTIAGSKASGYFVVEVDMSWGVNKVKDIFSIRRQVSKQLSSLHLYYHNERR